MKTISTFATGLIVSAFLMAASVAQTASAPIAEPDCITYADAIKVVGNSLTFTEGMSQAFLEQIIKDGGTPPDTLNRLEFFIVSNLQDGTTLLIPIDVDGCVIENAIDIGGTNYVNKFLQRYINADGS